MSILDKILKTTRENLEQKKISCSLDNLLRLLESRDESWAPRGFQEALRRPENAPIRVIAEFKRASPSAGAIRKGAAPEEITSLYEGGGAAAISVLTDEPFFDGHLDFLPRIRATVSIPVLRKDFIVDPYQVVEARAFGADGVLLIVAALDGGALQSLIEKVRALGMDPLVEVHSEVEAQRALDSGATLLGVNHRDLTTFNIDMSLTERLRHKVPADVVFVGESGIRSPADAESLRQAGADAILVGEHLMRAAHPGDALRELLGVS